MAFVVSEQVGVQLDFTALHGYGMVLSRCVLARIHAHFPAFFRSTFGLSLGSSSSSSSSSENAQGGAAG